MPSTPDNLLGTFLKDRRARLDPTSFGFGATRRRTPGLRREEVAQRANVSATWYTWLEQGRGGAPSADVLDRVARALVLSDAEREHLFLLAQHRPPQVRMPARGEVSPHLQRVLEALEYSPALVKNAMWDIVAWNRAAAAVLVDYSKLPPGRRNILKLFFGIGKNEHWENNARLIVAAFRLETARRGVSDKAKALVDEMLVTSPEFARMWAENEVGAYGEGTKHIAHPATGIIALDYSGFAVEGQPDLTMFVYTPATDADLAKVKTLVKSKAPIC
jgi:transcriptional regulator with XRE-family HTH domain